MKSSPTDHRKFCHLEESRENTVGSLGKKSLGAGNYVTSAWRNKLAFKRVNGVTI